MLRKLSVSDLPCLCSPVGPFLPPWLLVPVGWDYPTALVFFPSATRLSVSMLLAPVPAGSHCCLACSRCQDARGPERLALFRTKGFWKAVLSQVPPVTWVSQSLESYKLAGYMKGLGRMQRGLWSCWATSVPLPCHPLALASQHQTWGSSCSS